MKGTMPNKSQIPLCPMLTQVKPQYLIPAIIHYLGTFWPSKNSLRDPKDTYNSTVFGRAPHPGNKVGFRRRGQ